VTAGIDWYSRYVLSWRLPSTLDSSFCIEALEEALGQGKPEIFNTDQGVQYTSDSFITAPENRQIRVSMDQKAERSTTSSWKGCGER